MSPAGSARDDTLGNARYLTNWRGNFGQVLIRPHLYRCRVASSRQSPRPLPFSMTSSPRA